MQALDWNAMALVMGLWRRRRILILRGYEGLVRGFSYGGVLVGLVVNMHRRPPEKDWSHVDDTNFKNDTKVLNLIRVGSLPFLSPFIFQPFWFI